MNRYSVSATALNVRGEPSSRGVIVGFVRKNRIVEEVDRSDDRMWIKIATTAGDGWVSTKWLIPLSDTSAGNDPSWLALAHQEIGVAEFAGSPTNPRIGEYFQSSIGKIPQDGDEIAWCSAFANWVMETSGIEGTNSLAARSWENWGDRLREPVAGAVTVFSRSDPGNAFAGHVAFLVSGPSEGEVIVLGGNQGNRVSIGSYPVDGIKGGMSYKLLTFRWPGGVPLPA